MRKTNTGFTLIELMVAIAVIAIVAAFGFPGFHHLINNNRIAGQTNMISGSLALARSEAIQRGMNVVICASTNATNTVPQCNTSNWESGWIVFADQNNNNQYDPPPGGKDILLATNGSLPSGFTVRTVNTAGAGTIGVFSFAPNGSFTEHPSGTTQDTLKICPPPTAGGAPQPTKASAINIGTVGLIALAKDTNNDHIVNDINNNDIICP